jgi:hypothetical protein
MHTKIHKKGAYSMTRTAPPVLPAPVVIKAADVRQADSGLDRKKYINGTLARMRRPSIKLSDS